MDISFGLLSNESIMSSLTIASTKYPSSSEIGKENIEKPALHFFVSTIDFKFKSQFKESKVSYTIYS